MEQLEEKKALKLKKIESSSYKMVITEALEKKIRFVCSKIHNIEWSGVLFYTHEGDFEDNSLVITAQDMIVLDIGDATTTNFQCSNPDVISYMVDNNLLDCATGLLHSHQNFKAFFSGTDTNTLLQEGADRDNFLSLIVANDGNYVAGITRKITSKITEEKCYKTFGNKEICTPIESYETQTVEWFNLTICKDIKEENPFPELAERLLKIAETKKQMEEEARSNRGWLNNYAESNWRVPSVTHTYNNTKQLSMFEDIEDDSTKIVENPIDENHDIEPGVEFDEGIVTNMVLQILTGNMNVDNSTTVTMAAANSKLLYDRTFMDAKDDGFKYFAESLIDVLMQNWGEAAVIMDLSLSEEEVANIDAFSVLASYLISKLDSAATNNPYVQYYIELLNHYL